MSLLKSFFVSLGLDLDAASFAQGQIAVTALQTAMGYVRQAVGGMSQAIFGFNANAEATRLKLATIGQMNLKMPWEEAKASADELYAGLQADAARTPAETAELVEFASGVSASYFQAGKNMKDLRQFTTQAIVAAKTLNMEGIAQLDIRQALTRGAAADTPFINMMLSSINMTKEQFNALSKGARADALAKAFDSPAIRNAMHEFETNWAGVTSTLTDNAKLIAGEAGKPIFDFVKGALLKLGNWVQENKDQIRGFFDKVVAVLFALGRIVRAVVGFLGMLYHAFASLGPVLGPIAAALAALTVAVVIFGAASVESAIASAVAWIAAAAPVIALAALVAVALLLLEDIWTGLQGGNSLVFELWGQWKKFMSSWLEDKGEDPWWLTLVKRLLRFIFDTRAAWQETVDAWKEIFGGIVRWIEDLFTNLWKRVKKGAADALDEINPFSSTNKGFNDAAAAIAPRSLELATVIPRGLGGQAIDARTTIQNLTITAPSGGADEITGKVRKVIEEHHDYVMRVTRAALAGAR